MKKGAYAERAVPVEALCVAVDDDADLIVRKLIAGLESRTVRGVIVLDPTIESAVTA